MLHLVLDAVLIVRELVSAWSTLHFLSFHIVSVVKVHLWLNCIRTSCRKSVIDEDSCDAHAAVRATIHGTLHLWLLHIKALHLDKVLHITTSLTLELSFHLVHLGHWLGSLLHLELHVVEDSVKVHRIQFDRNLHCRILLEMHKRCLALLRINDACSALYPLALVHSDLFAIEDHQLDQTLDYDHTVIRFPGDWIVNQR